VSVFRSERVKLELENTTEKYIIIFLLLLKMRNRQNSCHMLLLYRLNVVHHVARNWLA
jgi:hypothetical protein